MINCHVDPIVRKPVSRDVQQTLQPLYNTVRYNTVLDITWFKDGYEECINFIEEWP